MFDSVFVNEMYQARSEELYSKETGRIYQRTERGMVRRGKEIPLIKGNGVTKKRRRKRTEYKITTCRDFLFFAYFPNDWKNTD